MASECRSPFFWLCPCLPLTEDSHWVPGQLHGALRQWKTGSTYKTASAGFIRGTIQPEVDWPIPHILIPHKAQQYKSTGGNKHREQFYKEPEHAMNLVRNHAFHLFSALLYMRQFCVWYPTCISQPTDMQAGKDLAHSPSGNQNQPLSLINSYILVVS